MARGAIGLFSWLFRNADRVLRLLEGLMGRLPEIGGSMERAGAALVGAGEVLGGSAQGGGAGAEVKRVEALLTRYEAALKDVAADLLDASEKLGAIKIPSVRLEQEERTIAPGLPKIKLPRLFTDDQTPLEDVANRLRRQIGHLESLGEPLQDAREGVGRLGRLLGDTATELTTVGTALRETGTELKGLAA